MRVEGRRVEQQKLALHIDPEQWVEEHGDLLFRFAMSRIGKVDVAEDLVQETLLSALRSVDTFQGHSTERTWLVAILKRKLIDYIRQQKKRCKLSQNERNDSWADSLFDERERWKSPPRNWGSRPELSLENEEFWSLFHTCLGKIPKQMAETFRLRELDDQPAKEICKVLQISQENLWVMIHRARLRLWKCLDINWFEGEHAK